MTPHHDHRRDPDARPSLRVMLAAALLDRGEDPERISSITGVPLALVELLREDPEPRTRRTAPR